MKIVVPGGSGQMGSVIARAFQADGHDVVVLSRSPYSAPWRTVHWDGCSLGDWCQEFEGADVVINLAGRSVDCRYSAKNRAAILDSRTASTRAVGMAIEAASEPPKLWLQASTATIYAHTFGPAHNENDGVLGGDEPGVPETWCFSVDVAKRWEAAADAFALPATRLVKLRMAMMMSPELGGVFDVLYGLVRKGLGGRNGDGKQFVSWIHDADFVNALRWIIDHEELEGPVNLASPNPLPNSQFMRSLRQAVGAKFHLPAARWMLELGAFLMRTETELILKSRRVVPGWLEETGFTFQFPEWSTASLDLVARRRCL